LNRKERREEKEEMERGSGSWRGEEKRKGRR
jgi:hypothetical protein